jgi:hypothetical protein
MNEEILNPLTENLHLETKSQETELHETLYPSKKNLPPDLREYIDEVLANKIPQRCPYIPRLERFLYDHTRHLSLTHFREAFVNKGLWVCIDQTWTKILAEWIGKRRTLEVMAGGGWIAKALQDHGVSIVATDQDAKWHNRHKELPTWPDLQVLKMGARKAVNSYTTAEVLVISWPPYTNTEIVRVMDAWGTTRPVIYIGESVGGCTACDTFFDHFEMEEFIPELHLQQWPGINDYVFTGFWTRKPKTPKKTQ